MKKNFINILIALGVPLSTFVFAVLANFVRIGFKAPDESFWLDTALTTILQMTFFLSFKYIFKSKRGEDERVKAAERTYQLQYNGYLDHRMREQLAAHIENEYLSRVHEFISEHLYLAGVTEAEYEEKYKFDPFAIIRSKLKIGQKVTLLRSLKWRRIKRTKINKLLPNLKKRTVYDVLGKDVEDIERWFTLQKFVMGIVIAFGFASVAFTTGFGQDPLATVIALTIRLVMCLWQIFMAKITADNLKKFYLYTLATKSQYFDDFFGTIGFDFQGYAREQV